MPGLVNGKVALGAMAALLVAIGGFIVWNEEPASARTEALSVSDAELVGTGAQLAAEPVAEPEPEPKPNLDDPFVIKRILPIEGAIKYGEWHWDDSEVPDKGEIVITVDLDARVLSIFRDGYEIGAAAVLLGTEEKPTPTGIYPITQKKRHHVSNLYDAPMPYMQRLTNDGITLHATDVEWGYASHGCIGMPEPFAAKVFAQTKLGDRVFITRGKMVGIGDSLVDS
jgi:lipoprotein-anchoring transpeptidase ErfK/SrfK